MVQSADLRLEERTQELCKEFLRECHGKKVEAITLSSKPRVESVTLSSKPEEFLYEAVYGENNFGQSISKIEQRTELSSQVQVSDYRLLCQRLEYITSLLANVDIDTTRVEEHDSKIYPAKARAYIIPRGSKSNIYKPFPTQDIK